MSALPCTVNEPAPRWLEALPCAAWLVSLCGQQIVAANERAAALFGQRLQDLPGQPAQALATSPEDLMWWQAAEAGELTPLDSMALLALPDGRMLEARRSITPLAGDDGGAPTRALVLLWDHSAQSRIDQEREMRLADLQATFESTADGLLVTDLLGHVRMCNRRFARMWGLPEELLTRDDAARDAAVAAWMQRSVSEPDAYLERLETLRNAPLLGASDELHLLSGAVFERVTRPLFFAGRPQGRVWSFRDQTERVSAAQRLEEMVLTDALTLLPNRQRIDAWVQDALAGERGARLAVLVVDLDRFRHVNDCLGHQAGDRVLQQMAERLARCLRQGDRLARLSGDQFAALLCDAHGPAAEAVARRMLKAVGEPCSLEGATFTLTCSIGIALAPSHGHESGELLRHAETAMRAVKRGGRADVRVHQGRGDNDRRWHMRLDHAMRQALVSSRLRLVYQPQVDLASGRIVGAEALLRWRDPELGDVSPGRFIPVAEETGFIVPIGEWVLAQAVRQCALWREQGLELPVAVNVSALQFQQPQFVERVAAVLAVSGLPAHLIELELTESILVHDADEALARLRALAQLGVGLSIDDFGTGYSSLAYLKRFPIDKLKIDRSFVQGLPDDETDAGIARAILQMARALGMRVIAEGVETEAQRDFLVREGCAQMQGFLYSPALEVMAFEQRLRGSGRPGIRLVSG